MSYKYKDKTPLQVGRKFIDLFIEQVPATMLIPRGEFTYLHGVLMSGMESIYYQCGDHRYTDYIQDYLDSCLDENKNPHQVAGNEWLSMDSLDFRMPGNLLFRIYKETGDDKYLKSIEILTETLKDFPKNSKGGFWHKKSLNDQMWLDGLYMASVLCANYSVLTGKTEFADMAVHQARLMFDNMRTGENNLLRHGWDESAKAQWADPETGLSKIVWGRALGWFVVASADIADILGADYPGVDAVRNNLKLCIESLVKYQCDSGFWCQVLDMPEKEGNWEETSCTCLLAYAIAKAVRLGIIDGDYIKYAKKAYEGVVDALRYEDGLINIDDICLGTNINEGTYEYYISCKVGTNDMHGTGPFLLMCAEMNLCE